MDQVADGIEQAGVSREGNINCLEDTSHRPENVEADLDLTLKQLLTSYLDVYLMHWPVAFRPGKEFMPNGDDGSQAIDKEAPSFVETWKNMCRIYMETKKVKAVGVSYFTVENLEKVIGATGVVPSMNQIDAHPSLIQPELLKCC